MKTEMTQRKTLKYLPIIFTLGALAATQLALSACNTVEGVGRDVEGAGDAVADTARDAKD